MSRQLTNCEPEELTPGEIESAAEALGLKAIKISTIAATQVIGRHLEKIGVKRYAHGLFLHSADQMLSAMQEIAGEITSTDDPELKIRLRELHQKYAKSMAEVASSMVETGEIKAGDGRTRPTLEVPSAPPAPTVIAVQNSVHVHQIGEVVVEPGAKERSVGLQP